MEREGGGGGGGGVDEVECVAVGFQGPIASSCNVDVLAVSCKTTAMRGRDV